MSDVQAGRGVTPLAKLVFPTISAPGLGPLQAFCLFSALVELGGFLQHWLLSVLENLMSLNELKSSLMQFPG